MEEVLSCPGQLKFDRRKEAKQTLKTKTADSSSAYKLIPAPGGLVISIGVGKTEKRASDGQWDVCHD